MSGIAVPGDRTLKQPVTGFCRNPQCREQSDREFTFTVEHDHFACPKCGADKAPMVGTLVLTHLLVPDPKGPVIGRGGIRWQIACDTKRAYLATATNLEAVTDQIGVVNCPGCLAVAEELGLRGATGRSLILNEQPDPEAGED